MRLLSWNTAFGRGTSAAIALADRIGADVLMLQEAHPPGLWRGERVGTVVPNRSWGSWVLVRSGSLEPTTISNYSGWVSGARWRRGHGELEDDVFLFSVHSPTPNERDLRNAYVEESQRIVTAICAEVPSAAALVIGGDFNFKSFGLRLPSEAIRTEAAESQALQGFRDQGLSVAWQDAHPGEALPQTLRWNRAPTTPYHCDGFLTRGLGQAGMVCDVLSSELEVQHSDHNPVVLHVLRSGVTSPDSE